MILAAASGSGCGSKPPPPPPQVVSVLTLEPQTVHVTRRYAATMEALQSADLRPLVSGYITGYYFEEGEHVTKGQVLFRIDTRSYRARAAAAAAQVSRAAADIDRARALLEKARGRVLRYAPLAATRAIPQEQYTDAVIEVSVQEAILKQARADRRLARANLEQARYEEDFGSVRAPIAGIIGARRIGVGGLASVSDTEPLVTVSQLDTVRVRVSISDADYLRYVAHAEGAPAASGSGAPWTMTLADGSAYPLPGHWVGTSRAADPQTGTLALVLLFPNPGERLRPGQYAQVAAEMQQLNNVLLIPVTSVRISQGAKTVSIIDAHDVVAQRAIVADERTANSYIVTQGLAAGDRVIVGGEQKVRVGEHVTARPAAGDAGSAIPR